MVEKPDMDTRELASRFEFQPATTDAAREWHEAVRTVCGELAAALNDLCPDGRDKSVAMTKVQEAMFSANAAVAQARGLDAPRSG